MQKHLVKVAKHILDLADQAEESQETLFALPGEFYLKLDRNEATIAPSPAVAECLRQCISGQPLQHEQDLSSRRLRRKLSRYAGVSFDSIICFPGISAVFEALSRTYLSEDVEAAISLPNDSTFGPIASGTGAKIVNIAYNNIFSPSVEQIVSYIGPKTRVIYISNPNSRSGTALSQTEIVFLLSYAEDSLIVIDESYFEFSGVSAAELIKKFSNLVVVRTFSKAFALAGLDVAYLMTDPGNVRFINRLAHFNGPSILAQVAAEAALDDINFTADYVRQINRSKRILFDGLLQMGYDYTITPANFILLKVNDSASLSASMARSSIYVNALSDIKGLENTIQITIGTPEQMEIVLDFLGRIAKEQATQLAPAISRMRIREKLSEKAETVAI